MSFDPVSPSLDLVALEETVLSRWETDDVFHESLRRRANAPEWVFYEGPPTANGRPGIHHVWARLFKDIYPRFHTMSGKHVARKGGWDCHGLPVEVEVEKELGFTGKHEIEAFGIGEFNRLCRESVHRYVGDFEALTRRIGMWLDTDDAYWTLDNSFIETVWWLFRQIWDRGDIYEGHKVVPYCGRCGTALSSHELGQPGAYRDVTEASVYVRFPVVDADFDLLVWTTTPWTLVSNVGAAVGPDVEYVRVRTPSSFGHGAADGKRDLVMGAARVADVLGEDAEIVGPVAAADLVGRHYERPFDVLPMDTEGPNAGARIVAADFVTVDDGSGIVHLAPAFGEIDREVGEAEGLPLLNPVGPAASFVDTPEFTTPWAGTFVKDADPAIIDALAAAGKLEKVVDYTHSYPHCWRCSTPLIYWAKPTWFARTSAHRDEMLRENEQIGWHPEHIKHGRFGDWLENNVDWALSRDRFWGTPLPVWRCSECGADTCMGSVAELSALSHRDLSELDLHRPAVDDILLDCGACGREATARRVEPVLDAWFDSGSMPAAQLHYPFSGEGEFERRFPADFICEAIDQTRGWFYSLLAVNTLVFDRSPYKNVVCLALVVDKDGQKMSKSKGNVIDPWSVLDTAAPTRCAGTSSRRVHRGRRAECRWRRSTNRPASSSRCGTRTRSSSPTRTSTAGRLRRRPAATRHRPPMCSTVGCARGCTRRSPRSRIPSSRSTRYAARRPSTGSSTTSATGTSAARGSRFWNASGDGARDDAAHATLHECLSTLALLLAPFCPFVADELHRNLAGSDESVHLSDWPVADAAARDEALEVEMARARQVVSLGLAARMEAKLKVRRPLRKAFVLVPEATSPFGHGGRAFSGEVAAEVADALNVKQLEAVTDLEGLLDYSVVPNFRTLGPRLGKALPQVKDTLAKADGAAVRRAFDADGFFELVLADGTTVRLGPDDVDVRAASHEELALAQEAGYTVALDTTADDELLAEGAARDVIRLINEQRKTLGFEIADRITVRIAASGRLGAAIHLHRDRIAADVLAVSFELLDELPGAPELDVDGEPLGLDIAKA